MKLIQTTEGRSKWTSTRWVELYRLDQAMPDGSRYLTRTIDRNGTVYATEYHVSRPRI